jgi:sirohydrochlorin ferrochelatase
MKPMDDQQRYLDAAHGMQTGVAYLIGRGDDAHTTPKSLRVGVNSAMCDHAALVRLLIAKGLFTQEEYTKEVADEMERERDRYERKISPDGRVKLR